MDLDFEQADLGELDNGSTDENFPPDASDENSTGDMILQKQEGFNDPHSDPQGVVVQTPKS
jgi:hypothetical protein